MTDKTLQQRLRSREGDIDDDVIDAAADALDAQAERIRELEDALNVATQGKYSELMLRLADQVSDERTNRRRVE